MCFIAHEQTDKTGYVTPLGDKRALAPIINNADIVCYASNNGADEEGKVIKSSGNFVQTNEYFARSRFDYIVPNIEVLSAENLEKVIVDAIQEEAKANNTNTVTFEEHKASTEVKKLTYDELMEELQEVGSKYAELDKMEDLTRIVEEQLGVGKKAGELKKGQEQVMKSLIAELKDFIANA